MNKALQFILSTICLIVISACSQGDSSGSGSNNGTKKGDPNNKTNQPATCEQAWTISAQAQPLGRVQQHENKSYSTMSGRRNLVSHVKIKETVLVNDGSKISKMIETENIKPSVNRSSHEETFSRSEFLELCKTHENQTNEPNNDIQTRTIGKENVSVKAGTFLTTHMEVTMNRNTNNMNSESKSDSWVSDEYPGLIVKSHSQTVNTINGNSFNSEFESELIYFKNN